MAFVFDGVDALYKVPRFLAKIIFAAGNVGAGSLPLYTLYVGMKDTSLGTIVPDVDVVEVFSDEDINTLAGPRAQLANMARAGLAAKPTGRHFIAAVLEPAGGTYAQATLLLAGAWTTPGEIAITIAGTRISLGVTATDTIDDVGTALAARMTASIGLPVSTTYSAGTDTLTLVCANKGASGRDWIIGVDKTKMPSGMTATLTGSAALSGDRARLGVAGSGTGTEDVTNILTKLQTKRFARIAVAQSDATNLALWETHVNNKADATRLLLEQFVVGANGTQAAATSLAQTTLNAPRAQLLWQRNANTHPAVFASVMAAVRAGTEGITWVPDYDGFVLAGIPPQDEADIHLDTENNVALQNGVTPLATGNNESSVVRAITTYCLNGATQDDRCLDVGDAVTADNATLDLKLLYETTFRPVNPLVGPDPLEGQKVPPEGVAYPRLWNTVAMKRAREWFASGWVEDPDTTPIISQFNATSRRIESLVPLVVRRIQHQLAVITRQQSPG